MTVAGQLVYGDDERRFDELGDEVHRILEREMRKEIGDRVAADGSNATVTVSGENVSAQKGVEQPRRRLCRRRAREQVHELPVV